MTLRLARFALTPRGPGGWFFAPQEFGERLTLIRGPNGSGKTPVMEGIAYALGNPADLPQEVRHQCEHVELTIATEAGETRITRATDAAYPVTISRRDGTSRAFQDAKAWSAWLLNEWGIPKTTLTGKGNAAAGLYVSIILPMFWVDQDSGWRHLYSATENFVVDQEEEITRLLLRLAPRRIFRSKDEYAQAKSRVQAIEATIDARRQTLEEMRKASGSDADALDDLLATRSALQERLQGLQSATEAIRAGAREFEPALASAQRQLDHGTRRLASLNAQKRELTRAVAEVASESELLGQNVTAQQMFRLFCGHENCQLFSNTEAVSYGRRLLYLGDQLKDLKTFGRNLEAEIASAEDELDRLRSVVNDVMTQRGVSLDSAGLSTFVSEVDAAAREMVGVELRIARAQEFLAERKRFESLISQLEAARRAVDEARPNAVRSEVAGLENARGVYQALLRKWLNVINAKNLPPPLVDERFHVHFGADTFSARSPQSGSTRTRIVLAMHAALLETSLSVGGVHPPLLLLDAPRQQELAEQDLLAFVNELRKVAVENASPLQIVLAVKDLAVEFEAGDVEWAPRYAVDGEPRFLRVS